MVLIKKNLIVFAFIFMSIASVAQPGGGGDPGGGEPVPFSGVEFLLVAGAALGIKRLNFFKGKPKE
jgi:hypothetical protein